MHTLTYAQPSPTDSELPRQPPLWPHLLPHLLAHPTGSSAHNASPPAPRSSATRERTASSPLLDAADPPPSRSLSPPLLRTAPLQYASGAGNAMESAGGGGGGGGTLSGEHWSSITCSEREETSSMQRGGADVEGGVSRSVGGGNAGAAEVAESAEETWMGWAGAQGAIGFALMALFYIFASISVEAEDAETSRCCYSSSY